MRIVHLSLSNFRNYIRLELDLPPHIMVLQGDNAQGKTNFLEAIYFLATTRSPHAASDFELINWLATKEKPSVSRLTTELERADRSHRVEIALRGKTTEADLPIYVQKHIRINGVVRHAAELIGIVNAVLFSPKDIELVGGEPALRRHYLDITDSQVDRHYLRSLRRYNRVLLQRNHLLRLIAEHRASSSELHFWDRELVETGSYLIAQRKQMVAELDELIGAIHGQLTGGQERLKLVYRGSVSEEGFAPALCSIRDKELAQGMTLVGPHRDDLRFLVNEIDMGIYGSRGQERTIALSLKLAEAQFMALRSGDSPILLLDDVLSELDRERRHHLLHTVSGYQQVIITTTDFDKFEPNFLAQSANFTVKQGNIGLLS